MIIGALTLATIAHDRITTLELWCAREAQRVGEPCPVYRAIKTQQALARTALQRTVSEQLLSALGKYDTWPAGQTLDLAEPGAVCTLPTATGGTMKVRARNRSTSSIGVAALQIGDCTEVYGDGGAE